MHPFIVRQMKYEGNRVKKGSNKERSMYRLTVYEHGDKTVDEFADEDELREAVDSAIVDIEEKRIKTFSVSWISKNTRTKSFWEKP